MNARELLKECRGALLRGQADEQMAMVAGIDAYLAAPSESAMEMVDKLEELLNLDRAIFPPKDSYEKAAALIEGLQRMVPRPDLAELWHTANKHGYENGDENEDIDAWAAKHGVEVDG